MHDGWLVHLCMDRTVAESSDFSSRAVRPTRSALHAFTSCSVEINSSIFQSKYTGQDIVHTTGLEISPVAKVYVFELQFLS